MRVGTLLRKLQKQDQKRFHEQLYAKKKKKLGNLKEMDRLSETQTTKPD